MSQREGEPPPPPTGRLELVGDETGPFQIERPSAPPPASLSLAPDARSSAPGVPSLSRAVRALSATVALTALSFGGIGAIGISRSAASSAATSAADIGAAAVDVVSVVIGVLATAISFWGLLAAFHLQRAARKPEREIEQLALAFGNLRSVFILQAIGLFRLLGASCFVFSIAVSLIALL